MKWNNNVTNGENGNIGVLKDMIDIRDGFKHCDVLDTDQVEQIIDEICVHCSNILCLFIHYNINGFEPMFFKVRIKIL